MASFNKLRNILYYVKPKRDSYLHTYSIQCERPVNILLFHLSMKILRYQSFKSGVYFVGLIN